MRTAVMALIALVIAMIVLVGVFVATDTIWDDGSEEVEDTGGFFSDCINEVLTDEETECGLFGDENGDGG